MVSRQPSLRTVAIVVALVASIAVPVIGFEDPTTAWTAAIIGAYLVLALTEVVPPFVPALFLLVATPLALGSLGPEYRLAAVLSWVADPVLALFAGGLALGLAAGVHGVDRAIAGGLLRAAAGRQRVLLGLVLVGTAVLSMWMSNIAAAAMMLAALRPVLGQAVVSDGYRRALLLALAIGANLGGIGTPIGSGPNALASAAARASHGITFLHWMSIALPLVAGLLLLAFVLIVLRYRVSGSFEPVHPEVPMVTPKFVGVVALFAAAVLAWVSEPLHDVPSPLVALAVVLLLFASGILARERLGQLDWSTLGLIAGGICAGRLLDQTRIFDAVALVDWSALPQMVWVGGLVSISAVLASVMSNTGTAALLIPLGMAIDPAPSTAIVIAIATSFGMPFTISTPANALAYGEGSLKSSDLLTIGGLLMIIGCALVTLTGSAALSRMGVP